MAGTNRLPLERDRFDRDRFDRGGPGERDESLHGIQVPDYRLLRLIGRGGMGLVFEAVHLGSQRKVALKVIHTQLAHSPMWAARFLTEARAASLLQHPGVVKVFDVGKTDEGLSFIAMEYLMGELLAERLLRYSRALAVRGTRYVTSGISDPAMPTVWGRAPAHAAQAMLLARQMAETLTALHARGVVHRDLKPENIILTPDTTLPGGERLKIFDFGIAKLLGDRSALAGESAAPLPAPLTTVGTVLGTPVYMSPEQWRGCVEITDRVDVYAAGGIFYELLVGHPPFTSQTPGQLMQQHQNEPPRPIRQEAPWVPAALAELVEAMLAKAPQDRPRMQAVAEFLSIPQYRLTPGPWAEPVPEPAPGPRLPSEQTLRPPQGAAEDRDGIDRYLSETKIIEPGQTLMTTVPELPELAPPAPAVLPTPQSAPPALGVWLACLLGLMLTGVAALLTMPGSHL
jgi:serine/threonine-protein kinase